MTPMRILILVVLIGITACNTSGKKNEQFKNKDTTVVSIPPTVQTDRSRFVLDTTIVPGFAGDTAGQINKTLELILDFDKASVNFHRDTFSVDEKTSEGCEIIIATDSSTQYIKFYGTLFGEVGKLEFSFYALNGIHPKLACAIFKDISYDKAMYEQDMKIRETKTTYEIYSNNEIIAVLNNQKRKQNLSAQALKAKELDTRQFFKDYIGQIKIGE